MSRVVDMHIPPAFRRWGMRLVLAIIVAVAIGYLPAQVLRRDPRTQKLAAQIEDLDEEARRLAETNATLARDVEALKTDVGAIEDRARADLGMVYPDEIVMRIDLPPVVTPDPEAKAEDRR